MFEGIPEDLARRAEQNTADYNRFNSMHYQHEGGACGSIAVCVLHELNGGRLNEAQLHTMAVENDSEFVQRLYPPLAYRWQEANGLVILDAANDVQGAMQMFKPGSIGLATLFGTRKGTGQQVGHRVPIMATAHEILVYEGNGTGHGWTRAVDWMKAQPASFDWSHVSIDWLTDGQHVIPLPR